MMSNLTTELGRALRVLGEHGHRLTAFETAPEQLDDISTDLDRARQLLADVLAEQAPTACRIHPGAPPDRATGAACLFCAMNRRRGRAPGQAPPTVGELWPSFLAHLQDIQSGRTKARCSCGGPDCAPPL